MLVRGRRAAGRVVSDGEEKRVYGEVLSYVRSGGKYEERRGLDERKIWRSCGD